MSAGGLASVLVATPSFSSVLHISYYDIKCWLPVDIGLPNVIPLFLPDDHGSSSLYVLPSVTVRVATADMEAMPTVVRDGI